jgi:NAD(P)-dependent dehydrogenase (short-subunit alcohol dehydrogenase family)
VNEDGNPTALVTGGNKNLGLIIAKHLKRSGYGLMITYRSDHPGISHIRDELDAIIVRADLTSIPDILSVRDEIIRSDLNLKVIVNNASTFHVGPLMEMEQDQIRDTLEGCVYPTLLTIRYLADLMERSGGGCIVNIGMAGLENKKGYRKVALHAAAKTALLSLTRSFSRELEPASIRVNMVSPETLDRSKFKGGETGSRNRKVDPDTVAGKIVEIINSDEINGENIEIGRDVHG